jgi:hypothetical protein
VEIKNYFYGFMSAKREQILWETVWKLSQKLERTYGLKAICSAGVLILSELSAADREKIIERAAIYPHSPDDIVAGAADNEAKLKQNRSRRTPKPLKSAG